MVRYITSFAHIAALLRQLTKSTSAFQWGPIEQEAFDSLKSSLTEQTALSYFVPDRPIRIYVDAGKKTEKSSNVPVPFYASKMTRDSVKYQKGAENITDYGLRHLLRRHDNVPIVNSVNELEEGLRIFVSDNNEYFSRMAKDDNDYQFLKEVIQSNSGRYMEKIQGFQDSSHSSFRLICYCRNHPV
ncbi:Hypothetical predicted protein [Paramuricea clavata]|uniref:Uncharacterized protein n=1 Tax=Paramuricea clavata TaxID=317549 RepID=A0A6S7IMS4_PARCT|nr:Hypothetical predicted protein [Paramuricea clavata]